MKRPSTAGAQKSTAKKIRSQPATLSSAQKRALECVERKMTCLTDRNGNIEYSEHRDLLQRLIKDPTLDATQEVLELFDPADKKNSPTEEELDQMVEDCRKGYYARRGWQAEEGRHGLSIWEVTGAIHEQMDLGRAHYLGIDGFRICARLLPEMVQCGESLFMADDSSDLAESIRERLQEMCKIKLGAGAKQKLRKARADLKKARKKCESKTAACGFLKQLAEEDIWDRLFAMADK